MASPTYADIQAYANSVDGISAEARAAFLAAAAEVDFDDWAAAADQLRDIIAEVVDVYGLASGEIGAQWYEYCRSLKYDTPYTARVNRVSLQKVRYDSDDVIDKLFKGTITIDAMIEQLANQVENQVWRQQRDVQEDNLDIEYKAAVARRDYKFANEIGYARVPNPGACAFCIMVASQGFVYKSEQTAKYRKRDGDKFHTDCKCEVVSFHDAHTIPGFKGKLDEYEQKYKDARAIYDNLGNVKLPENPDDDDDMQKLKRHIERTHELHNEKLKEKSNDQVWDTWSSDNEITIIMRWNDPKLH